MLHSEVGGWWTAISRSRWLAQVRVLLGSFGFSTALLYLSTEAFGKIAVRVRSNSRR